MSHGTNTTLILNPTGGTAITFNLSGATSSMTTYTCIVDMGRLDFNEEARWQWAYDQNASGGRVTGNSVQLVPLTFSVIIKAASADYRKAAYRVLQTAVMNRKGGTLQYKPEGAAAGTLTTYYHYVASKPPRLVDDPGNRWDADADADGFYSLQVDVELMTQPVATSDPANPVTIASLGATIDNWVDTSPSQTNRITVSSADLEGSLPALVRLLVTPASGQHLGRLILFRRSDADGTLADLVTLYEAEDAEPILDVAQSSAWAEVADSDRGGGKYMKCLPNVDANGVAHGLRFALDNPEDGEGRFAVFGIGFDDGGEAGIWTHQVKLRSGNISQNGADTYYAASTQNWQAIFAGEFELPLTDVAALTTGYDVGPYLEWYSTRGSSVSEFRLDAVMCVWVSDSLGAEGAGTALDIVCDDANEGELEGGVLAPQKLIVENLPGTGGVISGRAYVAASDNDLVRVLRTAPRGDFLELEPGHNHLLVFMQEQAMVVFTDDFKDYNAFTYRVVASLDSDEDWGYASPQAEDETGNYVEGDQARKIVFESTAQYYDQLYFGGAVLDLSEDGRFTDNDFVCIVFYLSRDNIEDIELEFRSGAAGFYYQWATLSAGLNYVYIKRSEFLEIPSDPMWNKITALLYRGTLVSWYNAETLIADYWRIEKADPHNGDVPNATGEIWDFQPNAGAWTITEDMSEDNPGAVLACLDWDLTKEKIALVDKTLPDDIKARARVGAKLHSGSAGIMWRAGDDSLTAGAEDGYAAIVTFTPSNTVSVLRYDNGTPTTLYTTGWGATAYLNKWYTFGVRARGDSHAVYAALSSTLLYDDAAVFDKGHLVAEVTDDTYESGRFGFLSFATLGRFDDVVIESIEDRFVPADQITVSGKAVFRTIAPFD